MKTIIVSDVHLGSRNCRAKDLLDLLHTDFDRLILNGDIADTMNLKKYIQRPFPWERGGT